MHVPHLMAAEKARACGIPLPSEAAEIESNVMDSANHVVCLSRHEALTLQTLYGRNNGVLVPNGVDDHLLHVPLPPRKPRRPLHVLVIGRPVAQKCFNITLEAVDLALSRNFPMRFRLLLHSAEAATMGAGLVAALRRLTRDRRVRVEFDAQRTGVYAAIGWADVLLHPANTETQGLAVMEALAAGRPVVCRPLPVYEEQFGSLRHLRYANGGDAEAFMDELLSIQSEGVPGCDAEQARASVTKFATTNFKRYLDLLL